MMMLKTWMWQAQMKLRKFLTKENGDVNVVSIVVLCGIAVALAVIFRNEIKGLIKTVAEQIENNATGAIEAPAVEQ